jgi:uncharacterized membrane protein YfcA
MPRWWRAFTAPTARCTALPGRAGGKPDFKERAISWVLAGGILGAFIGPNLASCHARLAQVPFAGAYLALVGVALLSLAALSFIRFRTHVAAPRAHQQGRPWPRLARQPVFIIAIAAARWAMA